MVPESHNAFIYTYRGEVSVGERAMARPVRAFRDEHPRRTHKSGERFSVGPYPRLGSVNQAATILRTHTVLPFEFLFECAKYHRLLMPPSMTGSLLFPSAEKGRI